MSKKIVYILVSVVAQAMSSSWVSSSRVLLLCVYAHVVVLFWECGFTEEAAHMDSAVFYQVVVPLMGVDKTAVLGISSPDDEFNYFSTLMQATDATTGQPFFYVIRVGLVCNACLEAGINCTHMLRRLPAWKGADRHRLVQEIMKDQRDLFNREAGGIALGGKHFCYDKTWIHNLVNKPVYTFRQDPQLIFMAVDPSGGGAASDYSIVSTVVEDGASIVRTSCPFVQLSCLSKRSRNAEASAKALALESSSFFLNEKDLEVCFSPVDGRHFTRNRRRLVEFSSMTPFLPEVFRELSLQFLLLTPFKPHRKLSSLLLSPD